MNIFDTFQDIVKVLVNRECIFISDNQLYWRREGVVPGVLGDAAGVLLVHAGDVVVTRHGNTDVSQTRSPTCNVFSSLGTSRC